MILPKNNEENDFASEGGDKEIEMKNGVCIICDKEHKSDVWCECDLCRDCAVKHGFAKKKTVSNVNCPKCKLYWRSARENETS